MERELHGKIASLFETGKSEKEDLKETRKLFDQANLELVALEREMDHFRLGRPFWTNRKNPIIIDVEAAKQDQAANEANRVDALNAHEKALIQHEELMNELRSSINKLAAYVDIFKIYLFYIMLYSYFLDLILVNQKNIKPLEDRSIKKTQRPRFGK